jgi:hypothetical protein
MLKKSRNAKGRTMLYLALFSVALLPQSIAGSGFTISPSRIVATASDQPQEPICIRTEKTSAGITIHHYYLNTEDFLSKKGSYKNDYVPGDPDCVLGIGNCQLITESVRIVYHAIGEY